MTEEPTNGNIQSGVQEERSYEDFAIDQLIVWRKKDVSDKQFNEWIAKFEIDPQLKRKIELKKQYAKCDDRLMLLTGPGVKTFIQPSAAGGKVVSGPGSPIGGEDGPVYYSRNYRVRHKKPDMPTNSFVKKLAPHNDRGKPIRIAVFDTGIDPQELKNYVYGPVKGCCIDGGERGWNFVDNKPNFEDDDEFKHGTIVTRFIAEQVTKFAKNRIEILPVKTHAANGVGDLYNILCAFAYAKKYGCTNN